MCLLCNRVLTVVVTADYHHAKHKKYYYMQKKKNTNIYSRFYIQPLKMELTQGSETSANYNLTPGKYPKEYIKQIYTSHVMSHFAFGNFQLCR